MRTIASVLILQWAGLACIFSADLAPLTLRCLARGETEVKSAYPPLYFFADQPLSFNAQVTAPLGRRLTVYADLLQNASGWEAPLFKGRPVSPELQFDTRTELTAPCSLPGIPAVMRPTKFFLKLYFRDHGQPVAAPPVGIDLFIYPRFSSAVWKKLFAALLSQTGLKRAAVFGNGIGLRGFFNRQQIAFDDLGADWPDRVDSTSLYLGDSPTPKPDWLASHPGAHTALFLPNSPELAMLPGIYSVSGASGGSTVKVTLPGILDRLNDDPRSQQTFLEIVRQALNSHVSVCSVSTSP